MTLVLTEANFASRKNTPQGVVTHSDSHVPPVTCSAEHYDAIVFPVLFTPAAVSISSFKITMERAASPCRRLILLGLHSFDIADMYAWRVCSADHFKCPRLFLSTFCLFLSSASVTDYITALCHPKYHRRWIINSKDLTNKHDVDPPSACVPLRLRKPQRCTPFVTVESSLAVSSPHNWQPICSVSVSTDPHHDPF